jgi:hypothetical protein
MTIVTRGQIYWLYPEDENAYSKLGLVIDTDNNESLFMMCHPDIHLAGHLDVIFAPDDIGLPFAVAVFTHVVQWVSHSRLSPAPIGNVPGSVCDDIELARAGQQTTHLKYGFPLADPIMEPRWPLIEQLATEFIEELDESRQSSGSVCDGQTFGVALEQALEMWDQPDLTADEVIRIKSDIMALSELLADSPDWFDVVEFSYLTDNILGNTVLALAA